MKIFDKFRRNNITHRKIDEAFYSIVAQEMESGIRHDGLWIKALERADGNKDKQVAEYIKLRVQSLKDDACILPDPSKAERLTSNAHDIEEFVIMLSNDSTVEKIEAYFSGMNPQEIHEFINQPDACHDYPIHIAIKRGRVDLIRWLLSAGANPQLKNYWGNTALETAERKKDQDAIALLQQYST